MNELKLLFFARKEVNLYALFKAEIDFLRVSILSHMERVLLCAPFCSFMSSHGRMRRFNKQKQACNQIPRSYVVRITFYQVGVSWILACVLLYFFYCIFSL